MKQSGYVMEYSPDHPRASSAGRIFQHRLVMECVLGRLLEPEEQVHHKDHNRTNNDPSNLEIVDASSHSTYHGLQRPTVVDRLTEQQVREALDGRTMIEAAAILGVDQSTIRRQFGHVRPKRRSPGEPLDPETRRRLAECAADPGVSFYEAGRRMGRSHSWVQNMKNREGLEWSHRPGRKVGATDLRPRARRGTGSRRQRPQQPSSS